MIKKTVEEAKKKLEVGDIVKVKIKKSEYKKDLEGNKEGLEKLEKIDADLKELEGELLIVESEMSLISFNKKKDWMDKFMNSDREFYFYNKDLSIIKKVDNEERFFKNYNSASSSAMINNIDRAKRNIESSKEEIKQTFKALNDRKKRLIDAESVLSGLSNVSPNNTLESLNKNKKIEEVQIKQDAIYIKTIPLDLYNINDKKILEGIQYVIEIQSMINEYPYIRISNISTYQSGQSQYPLHCCVSSGFDPCLGSVMKRTLSGSFFDLSLVISSIIMFLEKPDYETPHINEDSFIRYTKFKNNKVDDLSKSFNWDFLRSLR